MYWIALCIVLILVFVWFYYMQKKHHKKQQAYIESFLSYSGEMDDIDECDECERFENEHEEGTECEEESDSEKLEEVVHRWENTAGQAYINAEPLGIPPLTPIHSYKTYSFHPHQEPQIRAYKDPFPHREPHKLYELKRRV